VDAQVIERVREIISRSGMSQRAVASLIELDETKLTKSLSGKRRFTSLELALLADLGETSVDWILTGVGSRSFAFARRVVAPDQSVGDSAGADLVRLIAERFDSARELGFAPPTPELPEPIAQARYVDEALDLASRALDAIGVQMRGLSTAGLIREIERAFGVQVAVYDLPPGVDGLSFQGGDLRVIVLASTRSAARQRFTLGHELGHLLWGDANAGMLEEALFATKDNLERRANAFAAAFLLPRGEIEAALAGREVAGELDQLVWEFGVSPQALAWRLFNLSLLSVELRDRLVARTAEASAAAVGRLSEFALLATAAETRRPPGRLSEAYLAAYIDGEVAAAPVAQLTGWDAEEVRRAGIRTSTDVEWLGAFEGLDAADT
jgi:Zn-dependent peptidase ImmA (M78 family)